MFRDKFQHLNDEALLAYYHASRNLRAFRLLYQRHKDALYRYCAHMNAGGAVQVLEELWQSVLERPPQLSGRLLRNWLFIHASHRLQECADNTQEAEATAKDEPAAVSALRQLPRRERNIFLLHREFQLSLATVADIEKLSLRRCVEYYHRGREKLQEVIQGPRNRPWRIGESVQ